jgi:hypothetical protein
MRKLELKDNNFNLGVGLDKPKFMLYTYYKNYKTDYKCLKRNEISIKLLKIRGISHGDLNENKKGKPGDW